MSTGSTSEDISIGVCSHHIYFCIATHLTCDVILCLCVWVTEAAAIDAMEERVAIDGHLGVIRHRAGISSSEHSEDGKVWNTLGVVEHL